MPIIAAPEQPTEKRTGTPLSPRCAGLGVRVSLLLDYLRGRLGLAFAGAEYVAAGPAEEAGVVIRVELVELDGPVRAALRTGAIIIFLVVRCDTFQSVEGIVERVPGAEVRALHNPRSGERDRGPVGALDAAHVVVMGGIDVTAASGTLLNRIKCYSSPDRRDD